MTQATFIIFSGLPGTGKSTLASRLANHLKATYLRIDTVEQGLREVCRINEIEGMGYRLSYRIARENLLLGNTVISDSVNPWDLTRNEWNDVARSINVPFINIEVVCSDKQEHKNRIETRESSVPGLNMPTWEEVVNRDYQPWKEERISLDTAGKTIEESFQELKSRIAPHLKQS